MSDVPPPKHGLVDGGPVQPREHSQLVAAIMEARDCAKPEAEAYIHDYGALHAERVVRARWRES
jgi:hypothetical protein